MNVIAQERQAIRINKLSENLGAEVIGIDLNQPVDAATVQWLRQNLVEHIALVFRGQTFTADQFLAAASLFGEAMERPNGEYSMSDLPNVHEISSFQTDSKGKRKLTGPIWHTDHTNLECPPNFTALYAVELPDSGGGTSLCNLRIAYERLPGDVKKRVDAMKTANVTLGSGLKHGERGLADSLARQAAEKANPPVVHPLVRTHPENGSRSLYFNPTKTENIIGMNPDESQDFLEEMVGLMVRPELVYTHKWQHGDMLIWDNRSSLHKANFDYDPNQHRLLLRTIVDAERPV
jgi:taurine dioxygenase